MTRACPQCGAAELLVIQDWSTALEVLCITCGAESFLGKPLPDVPNCRCVFIPVTDPVAAAARPPAYVWRVSEADVRFLRSLRISFCTVAFKVSDPCRCGTHTKPNRRCYLPPSELDG
jgi:hypothetical protein